MVVIHFKFARKVTETLQQMAWLARPERAIVPRCCTLMSLYLTLQLWLVDTAYENVEHDSANSNLKSAGWCASEPVMPKDPPSFIPSHGHSRRRGSCWPSSLSRLDLLPSWRVHTLPPLKSRERHAAAMPCACAAYSKVGERGPFFRQSHILAHRFLRLRSSPSSLSRCWYQRQRCGVGTPLC